MTPTPMRAALGAALAAGALLSACAAPKPEMPPAPPPPGMCAAQAAQFAVGQAYGEAIAEEVRRKSGASTSRVLRPGMAVTMEYDSGRINIEVDGASRVTRVRCG